MCKSQPKNIFLKRQAAAMAVGRAGPMAGTQAPTSRAHVDYAPQPPGRRAPTEVCSVSVPETFGNPGPPGSVTGGGFLAQGGRVHGHFLP